MDEVFDLSWIVYYLCEYIQDDADMSLIDALEDSLFEAACGPDPTPGCRISSDLKLEFNRCSANLAINKDWQETVGSQIVLWLRNLQCKNQNYILLTIKQIFSCL